MYLQLKVFMKKWAGVLIIILAMIFLSYFTTGVLVKRTLNKNFDAFHDTSIMSVHLDKYQRGWFSSQALLTVKMHIPEQKTTDKNGVVSVSPPFDLDLSYPLTINHGPFIFTDAGIRFGFGYVSTRPQTHYDALIDYFNNTVFRYNLPALSMTGKSGNQSFQFEWLGLSTMMRMSPTAHKFDGNFTLFGLNGSSDNVLFHLGEIVSRFKFTYSQGLWVGQTNLSIPSISVNMGTQNEFNLEAFNLGLSSNLKDDSLNYNSTVTMKKLLVQGRSYGPGSLVLNIRNLDAKAMADINRLTWTMLEKNQNPELNQLALLVDLPRLLAQGTELELSELYFVVPEGKITGNLKIGLPKNDIIDPAQLLSKVQGTGQFRAPMEVIKKLMIASIQNNTQSTDQPVTGEPIPNTSVPVDAQAQANGLLQRYVDQGFLKIEGNEYVVNIKIVNQQILVNGKVFNSNSFH